ncbi:AI-2E family transporter [Amycolatopsis rhizosphaerae]|uniref:AI-2E family transporter n=1 Tax=Amycolatopsis rhizosphaerae TaxID=2053003 RepID=A0A558BWR7_9PSEU|nr:AI-2E family transporter [Amycolatopsis rhizosphaerae]TVT40957.1 AI-2E family transporter [Amycolatopsis rhizosphaerae]
MTTPPAPRAALPRGLTVLLAAAAVVVVIAGLKAASWFVGPVLLALVIVIAVSPVQSWARRHGWPGWLSTLLLLLAVYGIIVVLILTIIVSAARLVSLFPQYSNQATALFREAVATLERFGVDRDAAAKTAGSLDPAKLGSLVSGLLSGVTSVLANLVFLLALLLFLSAEASGLPARLAEIAADRRPVVTALHDFARGTRRYLVITTVFGFIVAVFDTIGLALLGVPVAVLWGVLAFITNYIPNVGFILGLIPPALLGLLSGGWPLMLEVIALYSVLNLVIQSLIQPRFVGSGVGLSATVTFLALIFWAWVLGGLGALLAIPMTLLVKALLVDTDPRANWVTALVRSASDSAPKR